MQVEAAKERHSKAWFRLPEEQRAEERLATLIRLGPIVRNGAATNAGSDSTERRTPAAAVVLDLPALKGTIRAIRRRVCEQFYMREMRNPELTVRTNRRVYVLPRQIAMYLARQLTGASLQEIGREFGGRHHTTVLHAVDRIEGMRRSDRALDCAIRRL